jgi:hypothetical protein
MEKIHAPSVISVREAAALAGAENSRILKDGRRVIERKELEDFISSSLPTPIALPRGQK